MMESLFTLGPQSHGGSIFLFLKERYKRYKMNFNEAEYLTQSKLEADAMEIYCDIVLKFKPNEALQRPVKIDPTIKIEKVPRLKPSYANSFSKKYGFRNAADATKRSVQKCEIHNAEEYSTAQLSDFLYLVDDADNQIYRDSVIEENEKADWWMSTMYYDENVCIHSPNYDAITD